jgi:hypothetical protein
LGDTLEIRMNPGIVACGLCGADTDFRWAVPTFNGDLVSNDFPDDLHREGGGSFPVCQRCYDRHERGELATFDRYYYRPGLIAGEGI